MENRVTHYKFEKTLYRVKNYKDTVDVPVYSSDDMFGGQPIKTTKEKWDRKSIDSFITEEKYLEYFADKTKGVSMEHLIVVVEEYGDKIGVKTYLTRRKRKVGSQFFYVRKNLHYSTYNLKTKNLYVGSRVTSKKKLINKSCRVNNFYSVFSPLALIHDMLLETNLINDYFDSDGFTNSVSENKKIINTLTKLISLKTGVNTQDCTNLSDVFYKLYLVDNGIKIPNTFLSFKHGFEFKKKELVRDKNLVTTYMKKQNLYGSKIRKYLNQHHDLPHEYVSILFNLLGVDYFNMLDITKVIKQSVTYISGQHLMTFKDSLNKSDKYKILIGLNAGIDFNTLLEHFNFRKKLKKYNHDYKIKFFDRESFTQEHYELSELVESYRNGLIKRSYGLGVEDLIQKPIDSFFGVEFFPVLLKTTGDYNSESQIQSNCVRTYIEKPYNIIVSLRSGSKNSEDRATVEYQFRRNELIRIQSRHKFNNDLPSTWDSVLEQLDNRMSNLYKSGILTLPIMTKECKNGYFINRFSTFEKDTDVESVMRLVPIWNDDEKSENIFDMDWLI